MKSIRIAFLIAGCVAGSMFAGPAAAQPAPDAPAQQAAQKPAAPTIVKTFGGWEVRCYSVATPAPCDVWEAVAFKESGQLAVSVSVTYAPSQDKHLIEIVVPLRLDLSKGAVLASDTFTSNAWRFNHCDRIGCYASALADAKLIDALGHATVVKVMVVPYGASKAADLQIPMKGFLDAHSAMIDLARQKTGGTSAPAAPAKTH